mgnify:CR=1 FL=1
MSAPQRIQLRRTKGWRKPEGAIVVARPSIFGNPFKVVDTHERHDERYLIEYQPNPRVDRRDYSIPGGYAADLATARRLAVDLYRAWATEGPNHYLRVLCFIESNNLAGHDLACWCPLDEPCHADVLLELANEERGA